MQKMVMYVFVNLPVRCQKKRFDNSNICDAGIFWLHGEPTLPDGGSEVKIRAEVMIYFVGGGFYGLQNRWRDNILRSERYLSRKYGIETGKWVNIDRGISIGFCCYIGTRQCVYGNVGTQIVNLVTEV